MFDVSMESLIEVTKCTLNLRGVEGPITVPVECEAIVLVFCSDVDSGWWASGGPGPGPAALCWTLRPMISLPGHHQPPPAPASYVLCSLLPDPLAILLLFHTHGWLIYAGKYCIRRIEIDRKLKDLVKAKFIFWVEDSETEIMFGTQKLL